MTAEIYFGLGLSIFAYGLYAIHRSIEWAHRENDRQRAVYFELLRRELQSIHGTASEISGRLVAIHEAMLVAIKERNAR